MAHCIRFKQSSFCIMNSVTQMPNGKKFKKKCQNFDLFEHIFFSWTLANNNTELASFFSWKLTIKFKSVAQNSIEKLQISHDRFIEQIHNIFSRCFLPNINEFISCFSFLCKGHTRSVQTSVYIYNASDVRMLSPFSHRFQFQKITRIFYYIIHMNNNTAQHSTTQSPLIVSLIICDKI